MTLLWNRSPRGGYWAQTLLGDEIVIHHPDTREWALSARGDLIGRYATMRAARRAAEEYVESLRPVEPVATVGRWSINDAGHLWCDGEYIGRVYEDGRERNARQEGHPRTFYAQGVDVQGKDYRTERHIGFGSSTAVRMSKHAHDALSLNDEPLTGDDLGYALHDGVGVVSATPYFWQDQDLRRGPFMVPDGEDARDWIGQMWGVDPATIKVWRDESDPEADAREHRYIEYLKAVEEAARQLIFSNDQERVHRWGELEQVLGSPR